MKQWQLGEIRNGYPVLAKADRKNILLLADDLQFPSGVGTVARLLVLGTCHYFNWIQIGGSQHHPNENKKVNLDEAIKKETGVQDPSVEIFCVNGYGNPQLVRDILSANEIDCIFHITDPRFWGWLYQMKAELESKCPLVYLTLWDDGPPPQYNIPAYLSSSMLLCINRQTHQMIKNLLGKDVFDLYNNEYDDSLTRLPILLDYVPHGQNDEVFYKLEENNEKVKKLKFDLFQEKANDINFICLYNSRNIRRKMLIDLILAYRDFCLEDDNRRKTTGLILHTDTRDENGTDLPIVIEDLTDDLNIVIYDKKIPPEDMNVMYNLANVTINIASNEGFGLASLESIMSETMVINSVTGGLQDSMRMEDEYGRWIEFNEDFLSNHIGRYTKCGDWAIPVFPKTISCQGSIPTPYIFDDRVTWWDVSKAIKMVFDMTPKERERRGKIGRNWVLSNESRMSIGKMSEVIIKDIELLLSHWVSTRTVELIDVNRVITEKKKINMGILRPELNK